MTQPLTVQCKNLEEIRQFLLGCKYVRDKEIFKRQDYWQPPEDFESNRKGDCDCFAIWAWRQLVELDYQARFVVGNAGWTQARHAWITFTDDKGEQYILEPMACFYGPSFPLLKTLYYTPQMSARWDGDHVHFYEHRDFGYKPGVRLLVPLFAQSTWCKVKLIVRAIVMLVRWSSARYARRSPS